MSYKYELGDKVYYTKTTSKDVECKCCGHVVTEYKDTRVIGKITARTMEIAYNLANGFINEDVSIDGTGHKTIIPSWAPIEMSKLEAVYKIGGLWHQEPYLSSKKS